MVVFKDNPEKYDSADRFLKIQEDMNSVMELNKRIKKMEEEVKLNPMVIEYFFKARILINFLFQFIKKSVTQEDELSSKTIVKHFTQ